MIQMRWLVDGDERTLQYRTDMRSEWEDVPEVVENINPFRGKCSKCGLAFIGPTSYTCTKTNCPTGLGSAH